MKRLPATTALILIDVQQAFDDPVWGKRNNPDAERNIATLLTAWRARKLPVIHVHHSSVTPGSTLGPEAPGFQVKPEAQPIAGEPVLLKSVNSGFIGTGLEARLHAGAIDTVVVLGITTDHCVSTTVRMAANLGFTTYLAADAAFCFERVGPDGAYHTAEQMHSTAIASLNGEFATVLGSADIIGLLG